MNTLQNPWSRTLKYAGWLTLLITIIASFFINKNFRESPNTFSLHVNPITLGLLFVSITTICFHSIIKKVPPLSDTKFWIKRALFDTVIALMIIPSVILIPIIFISISNSPESFDHLMSANVNSFSTSFDSPEVFFFVILATQLGFGLIVIIRAIFNALPKGIIEISFKNIKKDLKLVVGYSLIIFAINLIYEYTLNYLGISPPPQFLFTDEFKEKILLIFIPVAIIAPIFEELFFRAYLLGIISQKNRWVGLILTSLIFAAIHLHLLYFPIIFLFGIFLGLSYLKSKNILVPILIHGFNNILAVLSLLLS